tara:strand:- start:534 stop:2345 length:1812 start_codon:yes stop_codon:yes gene_type:complete
MCGIAGLYKAGLSGDHQERCILEMTDRLRRRGPDGGDVYSEADTALGHRRLSIIAPTPDSNQPMRRGSLIIVYNGELYNYREEKQRLESKGIKFKTKSDTEVVLALYETEGVSSFARLSGIFSFAIYNEDTGSLICVRDHFGVKPFLYAKVGEGIVFASELKSILSSGLVHRQVDYEALTLLLKTGSVPQPYTMVQDVKSLMPGHYMHFEKGNIKIAPFYTLKKSSIGINSDKDWQEAIHESIRRAVQEQLVADVPVGAFLSGGVDSGLIVALMREMSPNVKTYSVGFEHANISDQYDETCEAKDVADFLNTDHQTFTIADSDAKSELINIIKGLDHPTIDGVNSYFVSKTTSAHARVALSGTGADEIFGGYAWFANMRDFDNASILEKIKYGLKGQGHVGYYKSLHRCFSEKSIQDLLGSDYKRVSLPPPQRLSNEAGVARTSDLVMSSFLQNQLLPDIDTASMAHGLEVRVPYLNVDLVELCLAAPDHLKLGQGDITAPEGSYAREGTKKILIDIARDYLPAGFDTRPKRGFSMPMERWLKTIWRDEIEDTLSFESVKNRGIFDPAIVDKLKDAKAPWTQSWLLMATELWCRHVLHEGSNS